MLAEHRVDNADERLVAVEQPMPAGQQISLQPAFTLMLAEHCVQHATGRRQEFIVLFRIRVPLTVAGLEDRPQEIGERLVGTEDAEVTLILVLDGHIAQKLPQHKRILGIDGAGRRHADRVNAKIRHAQIAQEDPAIGVRVGAHPPIAFWREIRQFRYQAAVFVE